jgi:hypothetical protein
MVQFLTEVPNGGSVPHGCSSRVFLTGAPPGAFVALEPNALPSGVIVSNRTIVQNLHVARNHRVEPGVALNHRGEPSCGTHVRNPRAEPSE